jgi:hypothetical protein
MAVMRSLGVVLMRSLGVVLVVALLLRPATEPPVSFSIPMMGYGIICLPGGLIAYDGPFSAATLDAACSGSERVPLERLP